jgi:hypothetical protein
MNPAELTSTHKEAWLLLPWLANGRLSNADAGWVEEHVRLCSRCADELSAQRRLCDALELPDRVTYAPGPSFRKLLDRLDDNTAATQEPRSEPIPARATRGSRSARASLWRPPGLAWAASFIVMVGLTALISTAYRWSEPRYATLTDPAEVSHPGLLHIAFARDLTIGDVEELLSASGARVVEGPGSTGIFGVAPLSRAADDAAARAQILKLAGRLRIDPRVRWVEPVGNAPGASAGQRQ